MNADIYEAPASTAAGPAPSTELADALAAPRKVMLAGKEYTANLISFNDLVTIEQRFGSVGLLDITSVSHQRFVLSLVLGLPEEELGQMLTIKDFTETGGVLSLLLRASGLMPDEETETTKKKQPAQRTK